MFIRIGLLTGNFGFGPSFGPQNEGIPASRGKHISGGDRVGGTPSCTMFKFRAARTPLKRDRRLYFHQHIRRRRTVRC